MKLFLVSDIFGTTPALVSIKDKLSKVIGSVDIIDPYSGVVRSFEGQDDAYQYFMSTTGFEKYQSILKCHLESTKDSIVIIGFSIGASAIWGLSNQPSLSHVKQAFGFYGSQIRNHPNIKPRFDIELIFPKKELHFDVDELINKINATPNVTCKKANGMHGFMNELSGGFDPACHAQYLDYLAVSLKTIKS